MTVTGESASVVDDTDDEGGRRFDLTFLDEGRILQGESAAAVVVEIMCTCTDHLPFAEKAEWEWPVTSLFWSMSFGEVPDIDVEIAGRPLRIREVRPTGPHETHRA